MTSVATGGISSPTMPIPQSEVTLRLPQDGEGVQRVLEADTLAILNSEDHFVVPAGTVVQRRIEYALQARWLQELGWIFEVATGENRPWVRPISDLTVSPVTWEEVPLVNVEAPAGTPE